MKGWFQKRRQLLETVLILAALFLVCLFWFFLFTRYNYL